MKKSLIALAALAASGCAVASSRRDYEDQARGHELRALNMGGLEASLKAQRATAPQFMPNDGRGHWVSDKATLGAGQLGTPAAADTIDFRLVAGQRLFDLAFVNDDCDTGAAFVGSIGYRPVDSGSTLTPSTNYFAASGAIFQSPGRLECSFKPIKFEEDVYIQIVVGTAPAGISGNPEIHMVAGVNAEGPK